MAGDNIVGKVDGIQGGNILIIRSTGEQVVAKAGSVIFEGDTVVAGSGARVQISVDSYGNKGVVVVSDSESARFDPVLFDRAGSLIALSSNDEPVNVGESLTPDIFRAFNEALPSAGIRTAGEESQTDSVVEDSFGIERKNTEEIPDAGTPTSFGQSLSDIGEVLPGAGGQTDNDEPEVLPDAGTPTSDDDNLDDDVNDLANDSTEDPIVIPVDAIDDSVIATEDTELTISVLGNDTLSDQNVTVSLPNNASANGASITVNPDGTISYIPATDFTGTDTFVYTITSDTGETDTATVTVTVDPVNDASVLVADVDTTAEDTTLTVFAGSGDGVLDDDSDSDDTLSVSTFTVNGTTVNAGTSTTIAGVGTVQVNADGGYVFTPALNFNGAVPEITYTTNTGSSSTLNINVTPVDDASVLVADVDTTAEDTTLTVLAGSGDGVLDDDSDPDNTLSVSTFTVNGTTVNAGTSTTIAGVGSVQVNADGGYVFTPALNFNGTVPEITYTTNTGSNSTLNINVTPVDDDAPDAVDDTFSTNEDTAISSNVVGSAGGGPDTGVDNGQITPLTNFNTGNGTVTLNANGDFTYTPDTNFSGSDTFTYLVTDDEGQTDTATVTINVAPIDDPTSASPDTGNTDEDTTLTVSAVNGVLSNDSDVDDALTVATYSIAGGASNIAVGSGAQSITGVGTIEVNADGSYEFIPVADYNGDVPVITYTTNTGATSTLTITINPINDGPPDAIDDTYSTAQDTVLTGNVITNGVGGSDTIVDEADVDPVTNVATTRDGRITIAADGSFSYTPPAGINSGPADTYVYTLRDTDGQTDTATISINIGAPAITIPNDDSVAPNNDDIVVAENATTTGTFTISTPAGLGSLQIGGTTLTAVTLSNISEGTMSGPVNIPGAVNGTLQITAYNTSTGVVTYSYDPTGSSMDHTGATNDVIAGEALAIVLTDTAGTPETATGTLNIGITDTNPTANDDSRSISEGTSAIAGNAVGVAGAATGDVQDTVVDAVTVTDIDFGATDGTVGTALAGDHGSLVISSAGIYTYTLDNTDTDVQGLKGGESLVETFTYTLTDIDGSTDTANISVTINGVEDALPVVTIPDTNAGAAGDISVAENATITGGTFTVTADAGLAVSGTAVSLTVDGNTTNLTLAQLNALTSGPTPVTLSAGDDGELVLTGYNSSNGVITYNFDPTGTSRDHSGGNVLENYTIVATDNEGDTNSDTLDILITDTAPTAAVDNDSITEDAVPNNTTGNVITNDNATGSDTAFSVSAIDFGGAQTVGTPFATSYGSLDLNSDGTYTYTLDNTSTDVQGLKGGESFVETFSYTIEDTDGSTSSTTLAITINGAEDADPVVTIPDTNGGAAGDISVAENATITGGTFTVTADAGLAASGTAVSLTVDGDTTNLTLAQLNALTSGPTPVTLSAGDDGELVLTGYNSSTGVITYNFDPTGTSSDHTGGNVLENYTIVATDNEGDTNSDTLDILITDTNPIANDDNRSISEGTSAIAGNAVGVAGAATGDVQDTVVDAVTVTDIDFGATDGTVGTALAGDHGSLEISSAGIYTYTLDNTDPDVQGLKGGESLVETFAYTITDIDGDTDTANIVVTINGVEDAPPVVTIPDNNGGAAGEVSVVENATITGGTFTATASAGLAASGTALSLTVDGDTTNLTLAQLNALTSGPTPITLSAGDDGELVLTGYNSSTGVITYNFDPTGTSRDHSGGNVLENYTIVATDNEGDTHSDTLDILITDTAPTAAPDTNSVTEDSATTVAVGDVIAGTISTGSGSGGADTTGADTAVSVTAVDFGGVAQTVGTSFATSYGSLDLNSDGTYTYTIDNTNLDVQGLDTGESFVETFSYTIIDTDGDTSTTTLMVTVNGANELAPPVNTVPDVQAIDVGDTTLTFNAGNGNLISTTDPDSDITSVVLAVTDGTLSLTSPGTATVTPSNGGATQTITGTHAEITAALAEVVYTPSNAAVVSSDVLTITTTDANAFTDVDTVAIEQVGVAAVPEIEDLAGVIPGSTGLVRNYTDITTDLDTVTFDSSTAEALLVSEALTPDTVDRDGAVGTGIALRAVSSTSLGLVSGGVAEEVGDENSILSYTGLIYLEAGNTYQFAGILDESLYIELGGEPVIQTQGANVGAFNVPLNDLTGSYTTNAIFSPPANGYYTLEIYAINIDSSGELLLNLDTKAGTVDTNPIEFNVENFNLYAGIDELIAAGGQVEGFQSNAGVGASADGGYFPTHTTAVDVVGVSGQDVSISLLPISTSATDVISSITIAGIPNGITVKDAGGTVLFTGDGSTSYTFTPQSVLNPSGVDLGGLVLGGLTTIQDYVLTIDAVASNLSGSSTANAVQSTFTIGLIASTYKDGLETAISTVDTGGDTVTIGSGINDIIDVSSSADDIVVHGAAGNDNITGGDGNNILFGDLGNDTISAGAGADVIVGGKGSDQLSGNGGADIFTWGSGDGDGSTDTILDFTTGTGSSADVLDLSGLLVDEHPGTIGDFLSLSGTTLTIDIDGSVGGTSYDDLTIELTDLSALSGATDAEKLEELIANGNIVFDLPFAILGTPDGDGSAQNTGLIGLEGRDDDIFSGGLMDGQQENVQGIDETGIQDNAQDVRGRTPDEVDHSGNDRLIIDGDDTFATDASNNDGHIRVRGFTVGDVTTDDNADTLVIGDLLRHDNNAAMFNGGVSENTGAGTKGLTNFLHFVELNSNIMYLYIDRDGEFADGDGVDALGTRALDGGSGNSGVGADANYFIEFRTLNTAVDGVFDFTPNGDALNSTANLQALVDLGFLDIS
jgi:VCBS repeat-containing protein